MSIVRILTVSAFIAATSLTASTQAAPASPAHHAAPAHAAGPPEITKRATCEKVWTVQKVRHGTRQAFVAACVAKG